MIKIPCVITQISGEGKAGLVDFRAVPSYTPRTIFHNFPYESLRIEVAWDHIRNLRVGDTIELSIDLYAGKPKSA